MKVTLDVFNHSLVTLGVQEQTDILNEKFLPTLVGMGFGCLK